MSRQVNFGQREGRIAQMSRQEEVIARKRQELLERQRTNELAKQVVAAQTATTTTTTTSPSSPTSTEKPMPADPMTHKKNSFTNDGSFMENFKRITEAAKKAEEDKQKAEAEKAAKEREIQEMIKRKMNESQMAANLCDNQGFFTPDAVYSTNSMMPIKDLTMFPPAMPSILNLAPPPPPPPIIQVPDHAPPPPAHLPHDNGANIPNDAHVMSGHCNADRMASTTNPNHAPHILSHRGPDDDISMGGQDTMPDNRSECIEHADEQRPSLAQSLNLSNAIIPTTIDDLIECIALNGDQHEEIIKAQIAQMNERSLFRFLYERDSDIYRTYREKVLTYRAGHINESADADKYDPAEILHEDDDDGVHHDHQASNNVTSPIQPIQPMVAPIKYASIDNSDEYDSDTEYREAARERNLENMKRKIDSGTGVKRYAERVDFESDDDHTDEDDHMEMYRRIQMREDALNQCDDSAQTSSSQKVAEAESSARYSRNRKKRSRWGEKTDDGDQPSPSTSRNNLQGSVAPGKSTTPMLTAITRTDPGLLNYARLNYGTVNLTEEDWHKCEEHYKVNLLYQDMLKKRQEIDQMARNGRFKYEYDSDEDTAGGTWEHKLRTAEMEATSAWANALTRQTSGKHHIGDFLPPEELKKFMEIYKSKQLNREPDLSDYREFKLKEDNKGFQLLQKLGWTEGQGLGLDGSGIVNPVNKAPQRDSNQGLGLASNTVPEADDNEYDAYRKRMMLAYRFRPNPLNNPRRAYY